MCGSAALCAAANALRDHGWPPAFVFALPGAWRIVDMLFAPMEAVLGEGCEMDPSVFCWIAGQPPPLNSAVKPPPPTNNKGGQAENGNKGGQGDNGDEPAAGGEAAKTGGKAGANFGVPHRDFTCLQSLRQSDGAPSVLSLWLPLNQVTTENGCMMVIPKQLDPHFHKRFTYAHMRPALPPDDEGGATEVR